MLTLNPSHTSDIIIIDIFSLFAHGEVTFKVGIYREGGSGIHLVKSREGDPECFDLKINPPAVARDELLFIHRPGTEEITFVWV